MNRLQITIGLIITSVLSVVLGILYYNQSQYNDDLETTVVFLGEHRENTMVSIYLLDTCETQKECSDAYNAYEEEKLVFMYFNGIAFGE